MFCCILVVFAIFKSYGVEGTHFRGGIVTWKPNNDSNSQEILFTFKLAWQSDYYISSGYIYYCDDMTISSQTKLGTSQQQWICTNGCQSTLNLASSQMYCTEYNLADSWSQGENSFVHIFDDSGPFVVSFSYCCWVGGTNREWSLMTVVDLKIRKDTKRVNSSPVSNSSPIIRLRVGCSYSLPIHTDDPDGDTVQCRWSKKNATVDECGGICKPPLGYAVGLSSNPCIIYYTPSSLYTGLIPVSITLEDYPPPAISLKPLSSVSFQFLLNVSRTSSGSSCTTGLNFTDQTPENDICIPVKAGQYFNVTLEVTEEALSQLEDFIINGPLGITKSSIITTNQTKFVTVTWKPSQKEKGPHVFCFLATSTAGISTGQRCLTILADATYPEVVFASLTPSNVSVTRSQRKFSVQFSETIKRPTVSRNIFIYAKTAAGDSLISKMNTFSSPAVVIKNRTLTFYLSFRIKLQPGLEHYIVMSAGAVVGLQSCAGGGAPFLGISSDSTWTFVVENTTSHPCKANNGKGACQQLCVEKESGAAYSCGCKDGEVLSFNQHTCFSPNTHYLGCYDNCSGHGVCVGYGLCDCTFGWTGESCSDPVCYRYASCSNGRGDCIAPNICACRYGWGGPACSVDLCSAYKTCQSCTKNTGCGWCDVSQTCIAGNGHGPLISQCNSWFYYSCFAFTTKEICSASDQIEIVNCNQRCADTLDKRPILAERLQYCEEFYSSCSTLASCYKLSVTDEKCFLSWDEAVCPFALLPTNQKFSVGRRITRRDLSKTPRVFVCDNVKPIDVFADIGKVAKYEDGEKVTSLAINLVKESLGFPDDHNLLYETAFVESQFGKTLRSPLAKDGIFQITPVAFNAAKNFLLNKAGQKFAAAFKKHLNINVKDLTHDDVKRPLIGALIARTYYYLSPQKIPEKVKERGEFWKSNYNTAAGKGTVERYVNDIQVLNHNPTIQEDQRKRSNLDCIYDESTEQCKCVCSSKYKGKNCDELSCNCPIRPNLSCSGNGQCTWTTDGEKRCKCNDEWSGECCERKGPSSIFGDPHLVTLDGVGYDFFETGIYWGCLSKINDFGVQLAFFEHRRTSLVGAVALKVGDGVLNIVSRNKNEDAKSLPVLRVNGTLRFLDIGSVESFSNYNIHIQLSVNNATNQTNGVASYFFQFSNGISYVVDVKFSPAMGRQYIDISLGASPYLLQETSGLCGFMDNRPINDFQDPEGNVIEDHVLFGKSWKVPFSNRLMARTSWSWNESNFLYIDLKDHNEYFNSAHEPIYNLSSYNQSALQNAEAICLRNAVPESFLESCKFDIVVTSDESLVEQRIYTSGTCPDDCFNHGDCINGTCSCYGLWSGPNCGKGGCDTCPRLTDCLNGFCQCKFGYFARNGSCIEALCPLFNNCTSPRNGACVEENRCACTLGYEGPDCSLTTNCTLSCGLHGNCTQGNVCVCNPNWSGPNCEKPTCQNLQNCSDHGFCSQNALCVCDDGWQGSSCSIPDCAKVNQCSRNGICVRPHECQCDIGYAQPNCSSSISCPLINNCSGNGVCVSSQKCLCYDGYIGPSCSIPLCPDGCSSQGTCTDAHFCTCNTGWTGLTCNRPSCEEQLFCSGNGECVDYNFCECFGNWTGNFCNVPDCSNGNDSLQCNGRGECSGPGKCSCVSGYGGDFCEIAVNGTCFPNGMCDCLVGWKGYLCKEFDCSQKQNCFENGACFGPNECECKPGWVLSDCSLPVCNDVNNCSANGYCSAPSECKCKSGYALPDCSRPVCFNNCSNKGHCLAPNQCECEQGWTLPDCSMPYCNAVNNCSGNGDCLAPNLCKCTEGWTASNCSVPVCNARNNCSGSGNCVAPNECDCSNLWTGADCSIPTCFENNFCSGKGVCNITKSVQVCVCPLFWSGHDCSQLNCLSGSNEDCNGRGQCIAAGKCNCNTEYLGDLCETRMSTSSDFTLPNWAIAVIVVGVLLFVILCAVLAYFKFYRTRNKKDLSKRRNDLGSVQNPVFSHK